MNEIETQTDLLAVNVREIKEDKGTLEKPNLQNKEENNGNLDKHVTEEEENCNLEKAIIEEKNNHPETEVIEPDVKEKNEDRTCNQIDMEKMMNRDEEKQPTVQVNLIEHEGSDVPTHDVHNEDKQNQMELQTDNILTVDRIKIAGKMVSWGTQIDVLELESMAPIQLTTVVEYGDEKKHEDDTDNDSIPSSASQIG